MKQHITEKQWNSITPKQQLIFAKKFDNGIEKPEFFVDNPNVYIPLSIGQMIEFLGDDWYQMIIESGDCNVGSCNTVYKSYEGELCDALFEAVKESLHKER